MSRWGHEHWPPFQALRVKKTGIPQCNITVINFKVKRLQQVNNHGEAVILLHLVYKM